MPTARSAYVHIPFCARRCGYCNFTVVAGRDDLVASFLSALRSELEQLAAPVSIDTLFIGGGTPTHLNPSDLQELLSLLQTWLPLNEQGEWSVEANPIDCTDDKLTLLRSAGVNRISIGGQSFNDHKLKWLERDHTGQDLHAAIDMATKHFSNVSLDLIFAAPEETLEQWHADLTAALAHSIQHLSTYGLTIEKGSAFYGLDLRGALPRVGEAAELDMYLDAISTLTHMGFEHYEVSNFAKPGWECRHNSTYWQGEPWLAFGPGAARYDGQVRSVNHASMFRYIRMLESGQSPIADEDRLSPEQQLRERVVFGLRQLRGIDFAELCNADFPNPMQLFEPHLTRAVQSGWLSLAGTRLRLTPAGLVISDSIWPDFLTPSDHPD